MQKLSQVYLNADCVIYRERAHQWYVYINEPIYYDFVS